MIENESKIFGGGTPPLRSRGVSPQVFEAYSGDRRSIFEKDRSTYLESRRPRRLFTSRLLLQSIDQLDRSVRLI